jgi:hypothetical protein
VGKLGDVAMAICPLCGKPNNEILIAKRNYKGDITANPPKGNLCDECKKKVERAAHLVCSRCNSLVAVIEPGTTPDGFVIEEKATYHAAHCKKCKIIGESNTIEILELKEFIERKNKEAEEAKEGGAKIDGEVRS